MSHAQSQLYSSAMHGAHTEQTDRMEQDGQGARTDWTDGWAGRMVGQDRQTDRTDGMDKRIGTSRDVMGQDEHTRARAHAHTRTYTHVHAIHVVSCDEVLRL